MKIVFAGTHGTGKTSLLKEIVPLMQSSENFTEIGYLPDNRTWDSIFTYHVFDGIGRYVHTEKKHWSERRRQAYFNYWYVYNHYVYNNFIGSRSIYDTFAYSRLGIGLGYHRSLFNWAYHHIHYDFVFYIPIEFELEDDGLRYSDTNFQILHDRETKLILDYHHIPYHTIIGTVEQRVQQLRDILDV